MEQKLRAVLFDLDGVVFDTEPQYSIFWGTVCREFRPDIPGLENIIKGQTLMQIFDGYFHGMTAEQDEIVRRLNAYEQQMRYEYVPGFIQLMQALRANSVKTAVVTSSNIPKMEAVCQAHPEFNTLFDAVLTAEDFEESKPSPDYFLKAAARLGVSTDECIVCEDSFNGLKAGKAAQMAVLGLATTNTADSILPLCDRVVSDFTLVGLDDCRHLLASVVSRENPKTS